jgi:hypothetical protein
VSDYGLDDRAIGVRSPAGAKDFSSSPCIQTVSVAHPASCTMGTGGPFPGAKRGRGVTLTTHPYLMQRSGMSRGYTSSPPKRLHVTGLIYLLYYHKRNTFYFCGLYNIITYVGKVLGYICASRKTVRMFYSEIKGKLIFGFTTGPHIGPGNCLVSLSR